MIEQTGKHPWNSWKSCTTISEHRLGGTASSDICCRISLQFTQFHCLWCISFFFFFFSSVFRLHLFHTLILDADYRMPHPVWGSVNGSSKEIFLQLQFYSQQKGFTTVTRKCLATLSTAVPFQRHSVDQFFIGTGISRPCTLPQSK